MRREDFDAAVATHGRKVFTLAVYLLADRQEAEDVTQEVLVRLWRRGGEVSAGKIGLWLMRVTRNACIDAVRRRRDRGRISIDEARGAELFDHAPGPESKAHASQLGTRVLEALEKLNEPGRSVVILREIQGLSYREIGEVLEMPVNNVRVTLHRGRRRLRDELREVYDHAAAC
jgi:RNA polymerase sigma-70 factor (ECF subfamily)